MVLTHYIGGKLTGLTADFPPSLNYPELTTFIDVETFTEYILVAGVWEQIGGGGDDIVATGGVITQDGDFKVHTFSSSQTFQITSGSGTVTQLIVGGGGGGGDNNGGGGGAGGYNFSVGEMSIGSFPANVGTGGAGGAPNGVSGLDSSFNGTTMLGGGNAGTSPSVGGSGGGGNNSVAGALGTAGQGNDGGTGGSLDGGGGGGAFLDGGSGNGTNQGGDGLSNDIVEAGNTVFYAGGGGGGSQSTTGGLGGNGGGGNGAGSGAGAGGNGTDGLGGGGGGGRTPTGGDGGDGVVIARYFSPEFDPLSIAGLKLWLDADDPATFSFSSSNIISEWRDKSPDGNDTTQGTVSDQPLLISGVQNGKPIVRFDGTNDYLTKTIYNGGDLTQPNTIFIVVKLPSSSSAGDRYAYDGSTTPKRHALGVNATGSSEYLQTAGSFILSGVANTADILLYTSVFNGASSSTRQSRSLLMSGDAGAQVMGGVVLGAVNTVNQFSNPDIAEVLIYDSELSDQDRDDVEDYLTIKWGLP